jgi:hypothetical protein
MATGKFMKAKFKGNCAETGRTIEKGDPIYYARLIKKAFCQFSDRYKEEQKLNDATEEVNHDSNMMQDCINEEADQFCRDNNI